MTGVQTCALPICFPVTIREGNPVVVWVNTFHPDKQLRAEMISGRRELLTHFSGLFNGPITPDSYQQGLVAGLAKAVEIIKANTDVKKAIEIIRLHSLAQQAQDEKGVGDGQQ